MKIQREREREQGRGGEGRDDLISSHVVEDDLEFVGLPTS